MKVILSVEPVRFPLTGVGRYTFELARQLLLSQDVHDLKLFSGVHYLTDLPQASDQASTSHTLRRWVQESALMMEGYRRLMPLLRAQVLGKDGDHLYHGPDFFIPPFKGRKVATFHDLSPFTWAQCHAPKRVGYLQKS